MMDKNEKSPPLDYSNPTTPPPPEPEYMESLPPHLFWITISLGLSAIFVVLIGVLLGMIGLWSDNVALFIVLTFFSLFASATLMVGYVLLKGFNQYFKKK
jgi:hypothetical protein